jgi:transcriptional regulator with XRE-family HTH domain
MSALGDLVLSLRKRDELTLRQVEEMTDKKVSNAYLSQIEKGKISKPSPNILFALSEVFGVAYDELMELAGHISARGAAASKEESKEITNKLGELTSEEEDELLKYLAFMRSKKS